MNINVISCTFCEGMSTPKDLFGSIFRVYVNIYKGNKEIKRTKCVTWRSREGEERRKNSVTL